jgi:hypothetical protein
MTRYSGSVPITTGPRIRCHARAHRWHVSLSSMAQLTTLAHFAYRATFSIMSRPQTRRLRFSQTGIAGRTSWQPCTLASWVHGCHCGQKATTGKVTDPYWCPTVSTDTRLMTEHTWPIPDKSADVVHKLLLCLHFRFFFAFRIHAF